MFEDSLVVSRVNRIPTAKRWAIGGALSVQCVLAALAITLPMLSPQALPFEITAPPVWMPATPKPPVPVHVRQAMSGSSTPTEASIPEPRPLLPSPLPQQGAGDDTPPLAAMPFGRGMGSQLPAGLGVGDGNGLHVSVAPARAEGPLRISKGVTDGMLLAPIRPVYPAIARTAGIQGTVIVEAVISRAGTIESLKVVSGPAMLQQAAVEAIRAAKYRPYLLNGQPTEVETTITVNFRIGE